MNTAEIKNWLLEKNFKLLKTEYNSSFIKSININGKDYNIKVETAPFFTSVQVYTFFNFAKDVLFYCKLETDENDIELIKLIINSFLEKN